MLNTLTRSALARPLSLLVLIFGLPVSVAISQEQSPESSIQVIPQPRQVTIKQETFRLTGQTRIVFADPSSADDRFAAEDFSNDLQETAKLSIQINKSSKPGKTSPSHFILVGTLDSPPMQAALKRSGISVPGSLDPEGYVLTVNANEILVAGKTTAGTFYGLQTLKQLVRGEGAAAFVPGIEIVDWPALRWRGVSDDISRGPLPTVD